MPLLSVIIPTHKRAQILAECLRHLAKQTIAKDLEIIVVSDSPDKATKDVCSNLKSQVSSLYFFEIPKSQQGIARNEGVKHATADRVLFIGDDIFLTPDACELHLKSQGSNLKAFAVLGFTTWDPAVGITPVMRWLERTGWQFGYPHIAKYAGAAIPRHLQHRYTYTSNISLPTNIAKQIPFREDATLYGWEDVEWGERLRDAGIALHYEPRAKALHHHRITLEDSMKRMETLGRSAATMESALGIFDRRPRGWKLFVYKLIAMTPTVRGNHYRAFLKGLKSKQ